MPQDERERLEKALRICADFENETDRSNEWRVLVAAARAHLATLPAPPESKYGTTLRDFLGGLNDGIWKRRALVLLDELEAKVQKEDKPERHTAIHILGSWCPNCRYSFTPSYTGGTVTRVGACPKHAVPAPREEKKRATVGELATLMDSVAVDREGGHFLVSAPMFRDVAEVLRAAEIFAGEVLAAEDDKAISTVTAKFLKVLMPHLGLTFTDR